MGVRLDYWFSINVSIFIILTLALTETSCDSKKGKTPFKCYPESVWNETSKNCSGCKPGYYGRNCSQSCKYPSFGAGCQQRCTCREEQCDFSNGCSTMDNKTVEMDNKTVEINRSKETLFQDTLGTLFNTNYMSITVVSVVILVLITLMIDFSYRLICNKCSQRRMFNCHDKEKLPDDSMQEPVHCKEILNITVSSTVESHK